MLSLINLSKDYIVANKPIRVLHNIYLHFRETEFVSVLGESGSGKTTLLNIIGGLDLSNEGEIIIDNKTTKHYKSKDWDAYRNHRIGFVFQDYNLIPHLTILDNVKLSLTLSGLSKKTKNEKVEQLLTRLGLKDHMHKKPNQLSGGQKQRVAIARALINEPDIILADEPTGALDSKTSKEFMDLLKEVSEDKLIILVTHNESLAKEYSNRIIELVDGKVVSDTNPYTPSVIGSEKTKVKLRSSLSFYSALLLGFKNLLTKKTRTIITAITGSIGIIGIALTLALKNGFDIFVDELNTENFVNMPIEISRTEINIEGYLPPRYITVLGRFIGGYEPPERTTHNKLETFLPYVEETIEPISKSVVYDYNYGYSFQIIEPENDNRVNQNSSVVTNSKYKDENITDQFTILAEAEYEEGEEIPEYQAYIVVNKYNRAENSVLNYLGLPLDEDVPYDDVLKKNLKVRIASDHIVDLYITSIVKPKSELSNIRTGVYYNNALKEYLADYGGTKSIKKISIYADDQKNKDEIKALIAKFNDEAVEEDYITYLDAVELFSEIAYLITNSATFILISFSAISLFISSVLISIITYTSVLERTNEIGVLRSVGARKKDIARIFNAEIVIIGAFSGIIGIISSLAIIPILNHLVEPLLQYDKLARLRAVHGSMLIGLSVLLTFVAGFIPAIIASKKDPVDALRSK